MTRRRSGRGLELLTDKRRAQAAMWRAHCDRPSPVTRTALFARYRTFSTRLARDEWRRTGGHGLERADFEQLASEGLLQAIDRFDALRGAPFEAYARPCIRGAILNGLAKSSEASAQLGYRKRMERDRLRSLQSRHDAAMSPLDKLADLTVKVALGLLLEAPAPIEPDELESDGPDAFDTLAWNQLCGEIDRRIAQLPNREAFVLEQHYRHDVQFSQIATLLGVSKGRVSQLHAAALEKLRKYLSSQR